MKVKELIEKLKKFDPELEVIVTDGYECRVYNTDNITVELFEFDGVIDVDIGIGGCQID